MDPYVCPGTDVLRNLAGLRDSERLAKFEADVTSRRLLQLRVEQPPSRAFDTRHLRAIHRYIFQDVYDWAGEFRTVNISRPGQFPFAFHDQIRPSLESLFRKLYQERSLAGSSSGEFCCRAAYYFGELNAIHPFREGNGRTQREFIRQLGAAQGHALQWSKVTRNAMSEASRLSFLRGDNSGLEQLLRAALADVATG